MKLIFTGAAKKQFAKLDVSTQKHIDEELNKMLTGQRVNIKKILGQENRWRLRVGDYRVIMEYQQGNIVILVLKIGHRREVYR